MDSELAAGGSVYAPCSCALVNQRSGSSLRRFHNELPHDFAGDWAIHRANAPAYQRHKIASFALSLAIKKIPLYTNYNLSTEDRLSYTEFVWTVVNSALARFDSVSKYQYWISVVVGPVREAYQVAAGLGHRVFHTSSVFFWLLMGENIAEDGSASIIGGDPSYCFHNNAICRKKLTKLTAPGNGMQYTKNLHIVLLALLLNACASVQQQECPPGTLDMPDCPPADAVDDEKINDIYEIRTWVPPSKLTIDPIELGEQAKIPVNSARVKTIGPSHQEAMDSLAAKIWLIENARHTVDATYYIFKPDLVGYSVLGALCNAVKRGVDVRIMVDSVGSFSPGHSEFRAVETCAADAGFIRNSDGQITTKKARVQVIVFNAITKLQFNRRSHDKLLIVDGSFNDKAAVMTGGRNISLDYYGIDEDGVEDLDAFRDLEILIKSGSKSSDEEFTVGKVSEIYYSLLFSHKGNRRILPYEAGGEFDEGEYDDRYIRHRDKAQQSLATLKAFPEMKERLQNMESYMNEGFHETDVLLSHQLSNLTSTNVTTNVAENLEHNPNSILYILSKVIDEAKAKNEFSGAIHIVSPYLFSGQYYDDDGELIYDGAKETLEWLSKNPDAKIEIITNSVMTSDNFFTQAIIDMGMSPRFLLTPELQKAWLSSVEEGEFNPDIVESEEWKRLIDHPQIFIYQTGGVDSVLLGGDVHYGKLHAKFIYGNDSGFVGTSNFDYRSNLYNNELGFFFHGEEVRDDLADAFERLKATSYRWGTPEWLEMRRKVMESDSSKAGPARKQRGIYKTLRALRLEYLM